MVVVSPQTLSMIDLQIVIRPETSPSSRFHSKAIVNSKDLSIGLGNTRLDKDIMQTKPKVIPAPAGSETNRNHVPGEVALAAVDGVLSIAHPQCE